MLWSCVLLLPCAAVLSWFFGWAAATLDRFVRFGIYLDVEPFVVELGAEGRLELEHRLRVARLAITPGDASEKLRRVDLTVAPRDLELLGADLPYSGRMLRPGQVACDGARADVDVGHRGDTLVHWGRPKRSFRLRARSGPTIAGMHTCNLVVGKHPEQLNNLLSYQLARSLGLLAPRAQPVRLYLNGAYHGVYHLVEQVDAAMLRAAGREAGTLFVGELLKRDAWSGVANDLFVHSGMWEAKPFDGSLPRAEAALTELLAALEAPASEDSVARLEGVLAIDQFARLSVLEQLTQTHQFDRFHNWKLLWNDALGRFEPLVWDPVGWQETMRPRAGAAIDLHPVFTPLHLRLHAHAGFLRARDRVLREFFASGKDTALLAELSRTLEAMSAPLLADPGLMPPCDATVAAAQREFARFVAHCLGAVRDAWSATQGSLRWARGAGGAVLVETTRHRPVRGLRIELAAPARPTGVRLRVRRPEGWDSAIDLAGRWQVEDSAVVIALTLPAALEPVLVWRADSSPVRNCRLAPEATCYELLLDGIETVAVTRVAEIAGRAFTRQAQLEPSAVRNLFCLEP